jgi:hypothetical protein
MFFVRGARRRRGREEEDAEQSGNSSVFHTLTSR